MIQMPNINIQRFWYRLKYRYPTREVLTVALLSIAIVWFIWGSVQAMQKNYELKRMVETKEQEAELVELETRMLEYEQRYLQSEEYKKLAVRERLGYGDPGEKLLILPPNSAQATKFDDANAVRRTPPAKPSNFSQWLNFLFGGNVRGDEG